MENKIKPKLDFTISVVTIIAWLIMIGIIYQKFVNAEERISKLEQRNEKLESKTIELEIGFSKIAIESKYIAQNTDDIKKMLVDHMGKPNK